MYRIPPGPKYRKLDSNPLAPNPFRLAPIPGADPRLRYYLAAFQLAMNVEPDGTERIRRKLDFNQADLPQHLRLRSGRARGDGEGEADRPKGSTSGPEDPERQVQAGSDEVT